MKTNERLRNLDLGTLRSFVAIAETGSMTRAAARLYMTQSAVSMQIKRLESLVKQNVFERGAKGVRLTAAGEQLLQYARQMLQLNDEVWVKLTSPEFEGQIRLGVPSDIIYPHIPTVLRRFGCNFPRVQVNLTSSMTTLLKRGFERGEHDVILTTEENPPSHGQMIATQQLVWIGAPNGNAWKMRPLPIGFSASCAFRPSALSACQAAGIECVAVVETDDDSVIEAMISADRCVGVALECYEHLRTAVVVHNGALPPLPPFSIVLYAVDYRADSMVRTLAESIIDAYRHGETSSHEMVRVLAESIAHAYR